MESPCLCGFQHALHQSKSLLIAYFLSFGRTLSAVVRLQDSEQLLTCYFTLFYCFKMAFLRQDVHSFSLENEEKIEKLVHR